MLPSPTWYSRGFGNHRAIYTRICAHTRNKPHSERVCLKFNCSNHVRLIDKLSNDASGKCANICAVYRKSLYTNYIHLNLVSSAQCVYCDVFIWVWLGLCKMAIFRMASVSFIFSMNDKERQPRRSTWLSVNDMCGHVIANEATRAINLYRHRTRHLSRFNHSLFYSREPFSAKHIEFSNENRYRSA